MKSIFEGIMGLSYAFPTNFDRIMFDATCMWGKLLFLHIYKRVPIHGKSV